jgi:hypothetical protein
MMKFLRKYNRQLLYVFMAFLMIVFVGGSALEELLLPRPEREVTFHSDLGEITQGDLMSADSRGNYLLECGRDWRRPFGPIPGIAEGLNPVDWVLLVREAGRLGFTPSVTAEVAALQQTDQLSFIRDRAQRRKAKAERYYAALAEWSTVRDVASRLAESTTPSVAEIRGIAHLVLEKVEVQGVVLEARAFLDEEEQFSEEELLEQFNRYRGIRVERPGGLNFGYHLGPGVKIQHIKVDHARISDAVRSTAVEGSTLQTRLWTNARTYYNANKETEMAFRRPPTPPEETEEGEPPAEPPTAYYSWEEARETAWELAIQQHTDNIVSQLASFLLQKTTDPWLDAVRGEDGFRKPPPGVESLDYYDTLISGHIPRSLEYPGALSTATTGFVTADTVPEVPEIGGAYYRTEGQLSRTLGLLAFQVQGIVDLGDKSAPPDYLSLFQTSGLILRDGLRNQYLFRVVATRPPQPPESVDVVRRQVTSDLKTLRSYGRAMDRAKALMDEARMRPLREVFDAQEDLQKIREDRILAGRVRFVEPAPFARVDLVDAAKALSGASASIGSVGKIPGEQVERIFALADAPDPLAIVELRDRAIVFLVQFEKLVPAREDDFENMRPIITQIVARSRIQAALALWLDPAQIHARNHLEIVQR